MTSKNVAAFLGLVLLVVMATPLAAQNGRLQANIPFEFTVGSKAMPAGEYGITTDSGNAVVTFNNRDVGAVAQVLTIGGAQPVKPGDASILVFNRYGDRYFLSSVWNAYSSTGRYLPVTHEERELSRVTTAQRFVIEAVLAHR